MNTALIPKSDHFPTTRWSLVLEAGVAEEEIARKALGELCEIYWKPIYGYIRGRGWGEQEAEDLTQGFFASLLARESLQGADENLGKLRAFLLGSVKHFLVDEYRKMNAAKRGGGTGPLSLDHEDAERQFADVIADGNSPESLFERMWARTLIEEVIGRIEKEYVEAGKHEVFAALRPIVMSEESPRPQRAIARELGMSLAAVKVGVFRLRQRFRELLEGEIRQTLHEQGEMEEELQQLLRIWAE